MKYEKGGITVVEGREERISMCKQGACNGRASSILLESDIMKKIVISLNTEVNNDMEKIA